jgi:hypothetical protein
MKLCNLPFSREKLELIYWYFPLFFARSYSNAYKVTDSYRKDNLGSYPSRVKNISLPPTSRLAMLSIGNWY